VKTSLRRMVGFDSVVGLIGPYSGRPEGD